ERLPSIGSWRVAPGNSVMSAPAAKTNGFPVMTSAAQSPPSSCGSSCCSDSRAARPKNVGFVWSSPLSIVTSATRLPPRSTPASLNSVCGRKVLPDQRRAHAHPDAERGQSVAHVRPLPEAVGKLSQEPDARCRERVPARDRAAVGVQPLVPRVDAEPVAPGEHLHGEGLVQLEQADLVERQSGEPERLASGGNGAQPHHLGLDAREGVRDQAPPQLEAQLAPCRLRGGPADRRPL